MAPDRLYIVVRADLPPGLLASQAVHAGQRFMVDHPEVASRWMQASNVVAIVTVPDAGAVAELHDQARRMGLAASAFHDDDLAPALTSVALEPGQFSRRLCRHMPLALAA